MKHSIFILLIGLLFCSGNVFAEAGGARSQCTEANLAGSGRYYKTCVPSGYSGTAMPLIVVLHGCSQTAADIEFETEMTLFAESRNFIVLYPEQLVTENTSSCWNWFLPEHQARGAGEPADIMAMMDVVRATYNIDDRQIFITGISAGGAMSVIMAALYPDVFAAMGVAAGLEFKAGENVVEGVTAQVIGGPDPDQQGTLVYQTMGALAQRIPVMVFHGSLDNTVNPVNGRQIAQQWTQTNDWIDDGLDNDSVDYVADVVENGQAENGGRNFTRSVYYDANGVSLVEHYVVENMTHRWSGGAEGGTYTDPTGPKSSELMIDFFFANARGVPTAVGLGSVEAVDGRALILFVLWSATSLVALHVGVSYLRRSC